MRYVGLLLSTIFRVFSLQFRKITMSEHPNVYDMAYGVYIIIFPNPTMMTTGQWDFYICCAVVLLSRLRILGRRRFDSRIGFQHLRMLLLTEKVLEFNMIFYDYIKK